MRALPAATALPNQPIPHVHEPERADNYTAYRACARWDFGFTCALCFLHEPDLIEAGADRTGLVSLEHLEPQSLANEKRSDYQNCVLACRFCNGSRSDRPTVDPATGATLLRSITTAWSAHFEIVDFAFRAADPTDEDARRTLRVYALDDPRKTRARAARHRRFAQFQRAQEDFVRLFPALVAQAESASREVAQALFEAASGLERSYEAALQEISRYAAVPEDAPEACRCPTDTFALPTWLELQVQEIDDLDSAHAVVGS